MIAACVPTLISDASGVLPVKNLEGMMAKLTKRIVDAATAGDRERFLWCRATPGFGVRIYPSGKKVFVAQVRVHGKTRRPTIGQFGSFTVEQAREIAKEKIRAAASGRDLQREKREARDAISVGELCKLYFDAAQAGQVLTRFGRAKKTSTANIDRGRIARHIVPLIGKNVARDLRRSDVQCMVDEIAKGRTAGTFKGKLRGKAVVKGGAGTAARVAHLLGGIYSWGAKRGLVPEQNPVRGVDTATSKARDRYLNDAELRRLGKTLEAHADADPMAVGAIRLLSLTGLRKEEACALRWSEYDQLGKCLRLDETKTGRSVRALGRSAINILESLPRHSETWLFPNSRNEGRAELKSAIAKLFDAAGLADARSHDLRRTFATVAADEGYSDSTIGELLGQSQRSVTAKHYIRRPDEALVAAADRISKRISETMAGTRSNAKVVPLRADTHDIADVNVV